MITLDKILICFSAECYKKFCKEQEKLSDTEKQNLNEILSQATFFETDSHTQDVLITFEKPIFYKKNNKAISFIYSFLEDTPEHMFQMYVIGPNFNEIDWAGSYISPAFNISLDAKFIYSHNQPNPQMVL